MTSTKYWGIVWGGLVTVVSLGIWSGRLEAGPPPEDLFSRKNLVAWCIVPFDGQKRGPEERAAMLQRLGIHKLAYDYRAEHIPQFEEEIAALKRHGIELTAWWFPTTLNDEARLILALLEKHGIHTQLWVTGSGRPSSPDKQQEWVRREAARLRPIAEAASRIGCQVGLYNHGGWFGEPENQIAIIKELNFDNVGIVYNLHHGHEHVDRFDELLKQMKPYLLALNLNGMTRRGDQRGQKILPLAAGELDLSLLRKIRKSGYQGPIGILNHTDQDAENRLQDNLDGLAWLVRQLDGQTAGPRPVYRTWQPVGSASEGEKTKLALGGGKVFPGRKEFRSLPITVECRARLASSQVYNILVASDTKASGAHWEIFTMPKTGRLTAYLPGCRPDHVYTTKDLCDGQFHTVTMIREASRVRLFVDGRQLADQQIETLDRKAIPGGLAIGRLVEGGLFCHGDIAWVRISRGQRKVSHEPVDSVSKDRSTIELWRFADRSQTRAHSNSPTIPSGPQSSAVAPPYDSAFVDQMESASVTQGAAERGLAIFASSKFACLSCHRVGQHGGSIGPELTKIGEQRSPRQIIESLFWPQREVKPEYMVVSVLTEDGRQWQGYRLLPQENEQEIVLRDPATNKITRIPREKVEWKTERGTLMPEGLTAAMSREQQLDLIRFLTSLGGKESLDQGLVDSILAHAHVHAPAEFPVDRKPLQPENWPHWQHHVNRDRIYDFYTKQAEFFRQQRPVPRLLAEFPGLDGGKQGHWGNQTEETWANNRWNATELGSLQCGVFRGAGATVARGICLRLGEQGELSACFNSDTLTYDAVWSGGFVKFSSVRHGFLHGLLMDGKPEPRPEMKPPEKPFTYHGFYRHGQQVVFSYRIGDVEYLDVPGVKDGKFTRTVAPAADHPLRHLIQPGPPQWPQVIETRIIKGQSRPYAIDTIELPVDNPWQALCYCGGHDFLPDGRGMVCTMQGDVWQVELEDSRGVARWRRFASGLHHALGLVAAPDGIFVQCRDQLVRLRDLNGDGEADFYECFSKAFVTSPAGHDFLCGLERDSAGNFYMASGNQGLVRISADGLRADVLATGFRNPDGLGLHSMGLLTVPCSEGEWTPASMICAVPLKELANGKTPANLSKPRGERAVPHFGYGGPRDGQPPELPLVYLPRGIDNSSGGQVEITSDRWGPFSGLMIHLSFGTGTHFLLLHDEVDGQRQGAIVPLPGEFLSGVHRGRFHPVDGQLYVSGMTGWGSYVTEPGCFQRVRYTGDRVQLPKAFHVYENGIAVTMTEPIDPRVAEKPESHFAQCWNYRYSGAYGSPEYSAHHPGTRGHDVLTIRSAHLLSDGHTLFLELPELQPVNQVHLRLHVGSDDACDLFITAHKLDQPFTDFAGYQKLAKRIAPHPILSDMALVTKRVPNPWRKPLAGAREVRLDTGKNLTFAQRTLTVKAGEAVQFTLNNPDVVPHNWVLVRAESLSRVGGLANRLVSDPEAFARHYIPQTEDVLVYTDIVPPGEEFTIHFHAPRQPGRYPYLCTFPGHWMVMNGVLIVE